MSEELPDDVVYKCDDCGAAIRFGEWHVEIGRNVRPPDDPLTVYCLDCADMDEDEIPEHERA